VISRHDRGVSSETDIRGRLGLALREALRARDRVAASALRSALAAIGNAEAVLPPSGPAPAGNLHIAGAAEGVGAAEAERRSLSEAEIGEIVRAEITERRDAAGQYERAAQADRAERLHREADVLAAAARQSALPFES
jgi:uncharacterized protein